MVAWFEGLGLLGQIFLCFAAPASVILLIQIILSLVGMGHDVDVDMSDGDNGIDGVFGNDAPDNSPDFDPSGGADFQMFSSRSIISFFVSFGWMGVSLVGTALPDWAVVLIAFGSGVAVMALVALMMYGIYRLQNDGTADNRNALGVAGSVYLKIPARRQGKGKVNVMLQGAYVEREAVTDEETPLLSGTEVVVVGVSGINTLVVAKK